MSVGQLSLDVLPPVAESANGSKRSSRLALVTSAEVVETIASLASEAERASHSAEGELAFQRWLSAVPSRNADHRARQVFASEAGFAAAARALVEVETGSSKRLLARAFPHIYGSPLFSWFELSGEAEAATIAAIREHEQGDDPLALLGWLYQFSIPEDVRGQFGQFYTSREIVSSMFDGIDFRGPAVIGQRVIDPACGAGAFLIEATRRILAAAEQAQLSPDEAYAAVHTAIHGLDLNPLGILLTEAAIGLLVAPILPSTASRVRPLHLYITDALAASAAAIEEHGNEVEDIKARRGAYTDGFAFVIANPPYGKYPTRNFTTRQAARFARTTNGHPNLYGLFLQIGVELLADGGRLSYINPKSFVSGLYFKNLRRFLRNELDLERFDLFEKRSGLFDGVLQEVVILAATKRVARRETIELREYAGPPTADPARVLEVKSSSVFLGEDLDFLFFIEPDNAAHEALAAMSRRGKPITDYGFGASTGTIVWNRVKSLIKDESGGDRLPLIWGNGIREYDFAGVGNRQGKATHCQLTLKTQNIVSAGDAILVKRMTAKEERRRIVACQAPPELAQSHNGYFGENHINIVRAIRNDTGGVELEAVLGLLNSKLFDFVFRALNGNTQVSATELEMLPIAIGPQLPLIAHLARKLTASSGRDAEARRKLDELVFELYEIGAETITVIEAKHQRRARAA